MDFEDYSIKEQKQIMHNEILGMLHLVETERKGDSYEILDQIYWVLRNNEINNRKKSQL
tara:strand:+ start:156 stop:332 length:177 start_codon:yes stop_codon:yes gene_type:complete